MATIFRLLSWPEQDGFFDRPLDFHAMGFDTRIILQRIMNDPAIKCAQRFQFDHIAPSTHLLGGFLGFLDQRVARLGAIAPHIHGDLGSRLIFLKKKAVHQILQVGQGLPLPANEAALVFCLHIEKQPVVKLMFFNGRLEAEPSEQFLQCLSRLC